LDGLFAPGPRRPQRLVAARKSATACPNCDTADSPRTLRRLCRHSWTRSWAAQGIPTVFGPAATLLKTPRPRQTRNSSRSQPLQDCRPWHRQPSRRLAHYKASTVRGWGASAALDCGPGSLGDATPSSQGGAPSRPRVATLFRGACSATRRAPPEEASPHDDRLLPSSEGPAPHRSTAPVRASWPRTWPRPCVATAPHPARPRTRAPNCWGPFQCAPLILATSPRRHDGPLP
jgi:hypothetical protein